MPGTQPTKPTRSTAEANATSTRERIAEEHRLLRETLERVAATTDPQRLLVSLEDLRGRLTEHFAEEESEEGLHRVIGDVAPHQLANLQNLYREHRALLDELDAVIDSTRACCEGPVARVLAAVGSLEQNLHEHERRETELLADAVYTDLGEGS